SSRDPLLVEHLAYQPQPDLLEGRLVITGSAPGKKKEFVFLLPPAGTETVPVPPELLDRFHDDDQLTQWQQKAFPRDQPTRDCRRRPGLLRHSPGEPGDPVFFLREGGSLAFLGRAQMFRLPYQHMPRELVPEALRRPDDVDYADALFGYTRKKQRGTE